MEDRSTIIRKLVMRGYAQLLKEQAMAAYKQGKITMGEAALQANLTIWEMENYLIENGYQSHYSLADFEQENKLLNKHTKSKK